MADQFPNDELEGRPRVIIYMWTALLDTHASPDFTDRVTTLMRETLARLEGFIEGAVFEADDGKGVVAIARWKNRHAWARAEWEAELNELKAELAQAGIKTAEGMYYERARVQANHA